MSLFIHIGASGAFVPAPDCIIETETTHNLTTSTTTSAIIVASEMGPNLPQLPITAGDINLQVGSLEEPATSAHSPTFRSSRAHLKDSSKPVGYANCFGLPYQDHNYGAPPPPSPPPQSPKQNDASVDDDTSFSIISTTSTTNEDLPHQGESITRCICGFNHDDEYMICCDKCLAWQHVDCMGLDRNNMPDVYMCERCAPRKVDKQKAKTLQTRKREKMTADSSSDDSGEDNGLKLGGQHRGGRRGVRTKKVHLDKSGHQDGIGSIKKFRSIKKEKDTKKGKPRRRTKSRSDASNTVDEEAQDAWVYSFSESGDKYEEASCNQYTPEVQMLLASLKINGQHDDHVKKISEILDVRLCRMGAVPGGKGLVTLQEIGGHQPITEYRGKVLMLSQFRQQNPVFNKRCYPYVLFYKIYPTGEEICIDAREFGNEARFVRRSCTPNALIRHIVQNGSLRIFLFSCCEIKRNHEVTIPFDFNYKDCISEIDCACVSEECRIATLHSKLSGREIHCETQQRRRRASKKSSLEDDSSQSSITNATTTPITTTTTMKSISTISVKSECVKMEEGCEVSSERASELQEEHQPQSQSRQHQDEPQERETEKQAAERRKKMTREERKIDAYMRAFERMEKMAKRRQAIANHRAQQKQISEPDKNLSTTECQVKEEDEGVLQIVSSTNLDKNGNCSSITQSNTSELLTAESNMNAKEETPSNKVVRLKKGKRRRGSGTVARRRNRTSSGGSDMLSPDENPLTMLCNTAAAMAMSQSISSGGSVSGSSPGTPVPSHPLNGTVLNLVSSATPTLCSNIPEPASTPPPAIFSGAVTGSPECIIPKSKRYLMRGWLQEKAESSLPSPVPVSCPLTVKTENLAPPAPTMSKQSQPCYIRCTKDNTLHGGISAHLRRNSASGGRPATSLGSAKKRWLRQAMVEGTDLNESPLNSLVQHEEVENGHCSPMHNGCLSPIPNCHDVGSPSSISPPGDIVTPLKKRRLMRESLDSASEMLSPGYTTTERPASASSSSASPEHQPNTNFNPTMGDGETRNICQPNEKIGHAYTNIDFETLPHSTDKKAASTPPCVKLVVADNKLDSIEISANFKEEESSNHEVSETGTKDTFNIKNKILPVEESKTVLKKGMQNILEPGNSLANDNHESASVCKIEATESLKGSVVCDKSASDNLQDLALVCENIVESDHFGNRTKDNSDNMAVELCSDSGNPELIVNHFVNNVNSVASSTLPFVQKEEIMSLQEKRSDLEELLPIASALLEIQTVGETVVVSDGAKFSPVGSCYGNLNPTDNENGIEGHLSDNVLSNQICQNNCDTQLDNNLVEDKHIWISNAEVAHVEEISDQNENESLVWNQQSSSALNPVTPLSTSVLSPLSTTLCLETSPVPNVIQSISPHKTNSALVSPSQNLLRVTSNSTVLNSYISVATKEMSSSDLTVVNHSSPTASSSRLNNEPQLTIASPLKNIYTNSITTLDSEIVSVSSTQLICNDLSPLKGESSSQSLYKKPQSPPTTPPSSGNGPTAPKRKVSLSEYRLRMKENVGKTGGNNNITENNDASCSKICATKDKLFTSFSASHLFSSSLSKNESSLLKRPTSLSLGHSSIHNSLGTVKKLSKDVENIKQMFAKPSEKLKREIRFDDREKSSHSGSTNHKVNHSTGGSHYHTHKSGKSPTSSKIYLIQSASSAVHQNKLPPPPPPPLPPVGKPIPVLCSSIVAPPTVPNSTVSIALTHQILPHSPSMMFTVPPQSLRIPSGSIALNQTASPTKISGKNLVQHVPKKQPGNHFAHLTQPPPPPPPPPRQSTSSHSVPTGINSVGKPQDAGVTPDPQDVSSYAMVHKLATLPPPPPPPKPSKNTTTSSSSSLNYKENRPQSKT